jgi:hypothetical protein
MQGLQGKNNSLLVGMGGRIIRIFVYTYNIPYIIRYTDVYSILRRMQAYRVSRSASAKGSKGTAGRNDDYCSCNLHTARIRLDQRFRRCNELCS